MRKLLIVCFILIFSFSLIGCDITNTTDSNTIDSTQVTTTETQLTTSQPVTNSTHLTTIEETVVITTDSEVTSIEVFIFNLNPGIDTVEINSIYSDTGASAVVGSTNLPIEVTNNVDITSLGEYTIEYQVEYLGDIYTLTRYVFVVDQTKPVIILNPGIDTIWVGQNWIDSGAIVSDASEEIMTYSVSGSVDNTLAGQYLITYTASDSSGNTESVIRVVTVYDPNE